VDESVEAIRKDPKNPERRYNRVLFAVGPWDPDAEAPVPEVTEEVDR